MKVSNKALFFFNCTRKHIMRPIKSTVNIRSASFLDNQQKMLALIEQLEKYQQQSLQQGKEKHLKKARKAGKLLARERIDLLLDQDSFFLELLPLIGLQGKGFGPGGTAVCGIGLVSSFVYDQCQCWQQSRWIYRQGHPRQKYSYERNCYAKWFNGT
jgi:hypothetical protein